MPDTRFVSRHDTVDSHVVVDTTDYAHKVIIYPLAGDNWPQFMNAVAYQMETPGAKVITAPGDFHMSRPPYAAIIQGGAYRQCTPMIEGMGPARNVPNRFRTNFIADYTDGFGFGVQLNKGGYVKSIAFKGLYTFPNHLSPIQIDTLKDYEWNVGVGSSRTAPYAGIAVDWASDPVYYNGAGMYGTVRDTYLPGISRQSGSTAFNMEDIVIDNFLVGVIITPSNQQNGELIHLRHSDIGYCKTAYATCQAQSKTNVVEDLKVWGHVRTVFDNMNYGFRHGDGAGSPMVDVVNIADNIFQIFNISNYAFQGSFNHIYGELIGRIGSLGGNAGCLVTNMEVSFSSGDPGRASPDFFISAYNTIFENCVIRFYTETGKFKRWSLNGKNNEFRGGQVNAPPQIRIYGGSPVSYPRITGMAMYAINGVINSSDYDVFNWLTVSSLHINPDFSGWFLRKGKDGLQERGNFSKVMPGDLLITEYMMRETKILSWNYPVGYVDRISGDTIFLQNIGVGLRNGVELVINDFGYKLQKEN